MKFNVNETIKKAEDEGLINKSNIFKPKEGANRIRLLSPCIPYKSVFKGQVTVRFLCWILDRADGVIKLYFMPQTILDMVGGLQMSDDFSFEDVPMPYDITINAIGAGNKEVKYSVVGARQNAPLTAEELTAYEAKDSLETVIENLRKEQSNEPVIQQEAPQTQSAAPGYEKARSVADSLPGGNRPATGQIGGNSSPSNDEVNVEDIPY